MPECPFKYRATTCLRVDCLQVGSPARCPVTQQLMFPILLNGLWTWCSRVFCEYRPQMITGTHCRRPSSRPTASNLASDHRVWPCATQHRSRNRLSPSTESTGMEQAHRDGNVRWTSHVMMMVTWSMSRGHFNHFHCSANYNELYDTVWRWRRYQHWGEL